jgi:hypothetical protein
MTSVPRFINHEASSIGIPVIQRVVTGILFELLMLLSNVKQILSPVLLILLFSHSAYIYPQPYLISRYFRSIGFVHCIT